MLTVSRTGVITTRWAKGRPIHVARPAQGSPHHTALCGAKLRTLDWIERKKGSFIDEEELCPRCAANGAVAAITRGGLRRRLPIPRSLGLRGRLRIPLPRVWPRRAAREGE